MADRYGDDRQDVVSARYDRLIVEDGGGDGYDCGYGAYCGGPSSRSFLFLYPPVQRPLRAVQVLLRGPAEEASAFLRHGATMGGCISLCGDPVVAANGEWVRQGDVGGGRHIWADWVPHPKERHRGSTVTAAGPPCSPVSMVASK